VTDLESVKSFQDLQDAAKGDAMELVRLMLNAWMIHFKMNEKGQPPAGYPPAPVAVAHAYAAPVQAVAMAQAYPQPVAIAQQAAPVQAYAQPVRAAPVAYVEAAPVQVSWAPLFMLLPCGPDSLATLDWTYMGGGMQGYAAQAQPPMMQAYAPQSSMPPVDEYSSSLLELLLPTPSAPQSPGL
jgi:hypothetical protein